MAHDGGGDTRAMESAVRLIGDRHSLLILLAVVRGGSRFNQLQRWLGIRRNTLALRLSALVAAEVLEKRPVAAGSSLQEYHLARNADPLRGALEAILAWAAAQDEAGSRGSGRLH